MERLLLVDGSNLLFQMFYGMPNAILDGTGRDIRGTVGFLGALRKILKMVEPTHVAVLFDGECENVRMLADKSYKANRPDYSQVPEEETPFCQLPLIYAALEELKLCYRETVCCETDDWIAGYALTLGKDMEVVISSFDSDYFQLITDKVSVLRYRGDRSMVWTTQTVREKLGIEPGQYADFKSLTGDSADNIPGVPKVGPKTAAQLLRQFGNLETLLTEAERIERPMLREAIQASRERLRLNYSLIRLENREELPFTREELAWKRRDFATRQVLAEIERREKSNGDGCQ